MAGTMKNLFVSIFVACLSCCKHGVQGSDQAIEHALIYHTNEWLVHEVEPAVALFLKISIEPNFFQG